MSYRYYATGHYRRELFPKGIKWLLIINVTAYLLSQFDLRFFIYYFGLVPVLAVARLYVWQFVTYMFLHGSFFHILFNMFALWMFGRDIETLWGTRRFLTYYFVTGIGAGILSAIISVFFRTWMIPVIGASGAVFGILLAFGMLFPDRPVFVYFLFPIPARILVILFAAIELIAGFTQTNNGVANFAHLGGMLIGYLYLKGRLNLKWLRTGATSRRSKRSFTVVDGSSKSSRQQIDKILDKISSQGIDSLTPEERKALEDYSKDR